MLVADAVSEHPNAARAEQSPVGGVDQGVVEDPLLDVVGHAVGVSSSGTAFLLNAATPWKRELAVGIIFGLLHLPNPILVPATFLAGWVFAILFRRYPSLPALALSHAVGSTAVAFCFDPATLHKMRVGPRYFHVRS